MSGGIECRKQLIDFFRRRSAVARESRANSVYGSGIEQLHVAKGIIGSKLQPLVALHEH